MHTLEIENVIPFCKKGEPKHKLELAVLVLWIFGIDTYVLEPHGVALLP
jgi:hypothetical protein